MELRHRRVNQFGEVSIPKLHGSRMGPGVEENVFIFGEQLIDVDSHVVEITERRHRPHFAVRKEFCEFLFRCQPHVFAVQRLF